LGTIGGSAISTKPILQSRVINTEAVSQDESVRQAGEQLLKALAQELKGAPRAVAEQRLSYTFSDLWNQAERDIFRNLPAQVGGRGEGPGRKPD